MARKTSGFLAVVASAALVSACATPAGLSDPTAQRLVGRWSQVLYEGPARDEITIELDSSAAIQVKVTRHEVTGKRDYAGSGKWHVEDGYFVSDLSFAGPPNAVNHLAGRHRIVAVTDWEWVLEWVNREQVRAWRYPK